MLGALTLAALALPMTLTYSTFELIEGAAVRRLENATAAHGRPLGSQLTSTPRGGGYLIRDRRGHSEGIGAHEMHAGIKQLAADSVARLFAAVVNPAPKPAVRFPEVIGRTTTVSIPTRHGPTPATIYYPPRQHHRQAAAVYVNVHGGGFVVGHREQDDPWCRYLAGHGQVVVVNTDYVLAPHQRFPAPVEQIYDVLGWASSPDREWDGSELCVGGQSAGGNLAAGAARLALENGGPRVRLQVLHYAPLDLVTRARDKPTPLGRRAVLKPWMGAIFDTAYIPDSDTRRHRLASPAWRSNGEGLAGIAPALIVTAEYDRLRDEADAYGRNLDAVGSLAGYLEVPALDHGYNIMSAAPDAADATRLMYARIAEHVARATSSGQ